MGEVYLGGGPLCWAVVFFFVILIGIGVLGRFSRFEGAKKNYRVCLMEREIARTFFFIRIETDCSCSVTTLQVLDGKSEAVSK